MTITCFREELIISLLRDVETVDQNDEAVIEHVLEHLGRSKRRRCVHCYAKLVEELGRVEAAKKNTTISI